MLTVMISDVWPAGPVAPGDPPPLPVAKASSGAVPPATPPAGETFGAGAFTSAASAIVALVVCEGHRLAADGEVAALRPADVVVRKQDSPQVGVAAEDDSKEVESFALLELGSGKKLTARVDFRKRFFRGWRCRGDHPRGGFSDRRGWWVPCSDRTRGRGRIRKQCLDPDALDPVAVEQLVVDGKPRLRRQVVRRVQAGEEPVALAGGVAEPGEHCQQVAGIDREACAAVLEAAVEDRAR